MVAVSYQRRIAWLGEARWRNQLMSLADLATLQQKGRQWQGAERGWRIYYALFSRSGFTQPLLDRATTDPELLLFDPAMVITAEA